METAMNDSSLTDDLFGASSYEFERPVKKNFLPWHKPRKQFVREKQWTQLLLQLVQDNSPETGVIKYLGLPGDDLLDLRYFHDKVCVPNNLKLKFLGFNKGMKPGEEHKANLEVSLDEVNRLTHIDNTSKLVDYEFTNIARSGSSALQDSQAIGPFDVINIDLCDGFAKQPVSPFEETHYNTFSRLMALQARRKQPWLLFLTTRTNSNGVNSEVFKRLKGLYGENLENCAKFKTFSIDMLSIDSAEALESRCGDDLGFSNIFIISLCKWILQIAMHQSPKSEIFLHDAYSYKVYKGATFPDLISIAIEVTPTFRVSEDPLKLTTISDDSLIDECVSATQILEAVSKQCDVDKILAEDEKLRAAMIESSKILLDQARYDISGYEDWVLSQ
ncbi:MAG: hypothetical protein SF053_10490 [Bacteroidia bacterium]|nr:hypothetical protein [Bacteroidia bacterium]